MPVKIAIEKLRGFVADHQARIVAIDGNQVRLEIDGKSGEPAAPADRSPGHALRRSAIRGGACAEGPREGRRRWTPARRGRRSRSPSARGKDRDRRRNDVMAHARKVLTSFRSYLMAYEDESVPSPGR